MTRKAIVVRCLDALHGSKHVRALGGLALVLHGLGHAVYPLRGAAALAHSGAAKVIIALAWQTAMIGFVAAGLAFLGARPLHRWRRTLTAVAVAASVVAFSVLRHVDLLPGLLIDALALVAFYRIPSETDVRSAATAPPRWRRWLGALASASALALVGYVTVCAVTRSWHHRWGASDEELDLAFPGDIPNRDPAFEINHAITIHAPPSVVWPWLVQIGQDRAGFYSYEALENSFGLRIRNADRIRAEWQDRAVGDLVRGAPPDWMGGLFGEDLGWTVSHVEPERALVLRWWGSFVLVPLPGERTRLLVRSTMSGGRNVPVWGAALTFATLELPHFIMERAMLLGIKRRAESHDEPTPATPPGTAIATH